MALLDSYLLEIYESGTNPVQGWLALCYIHQIIENKGSTVFQNHNGENVKKYIVNIYLI